MNRNRIPLFVGLDYHMSGVQVCALNGQGSIERNRPCQNDWEAIVRAIGTHGRPVHAAIESCAGAANLAEQLVSLAGWSVHLAHPGYVRRMKQNPDKTDFSDAHVLADLERVGYLPRVWMAPYAVRELRKLVRYRQQLIDERKNLKMRIKAMLREHRLIAPGQAGGRWTRQWIAWLRQTDGLGEQSRWITDRHLARLEALVHEVRDLEQRLEKLTAHDPMVQRMRRQSGIGPVTSWVMRACIGRFDRFRTGKQLCRYCGLSPRNDSSGQRQVQSGLIKAGDDLLKSTLIQVGHRLLRHDPRWNAMGQRMRAKGKKYCVVVAAIVNRWMRCVFHELKEPTMMQTD